MSSLISLKLMAELPDEATALRFQTEVQVRIADFGGIRQSATKRYWKIPEWFEVTLLLQPGSTTSLVFDSILSSLGEGWERHDICDEEQWAIWNPKAGSKFCSSDVRWAHVQRFPANQMELGLPPSLLAYLADAELRLGSWDGTAETLVLGITKEIGPEEGVIILTGVRHVNLPSLLTISGIECRGEDGLPSGFFETYRPNDQHLDPDERVYLFHGAWGEEFFVVAENLEYRTTAAD